MRLFFYGTLLDWDVQSAVLARVLDRRDLMPSVLRHFRCVYIAGRSYPMVVPQRGSLVEGVVAEGLSRDDLWRIALYEGDDYHRERRLVFTSACPTQPAQSPIDAWLYRSRRRARPSTRDWRLAVWQGSEKAKYLREIGTDRRTPWRVSRG
jgi:hypothetical protein